MYEDISDLLEAIVLADTNKSDSGSTVDISEEIDDNVKTDGSDAARFRH